MIEFQPTPYCCCTLTITLTLTFDLSTQTMLLLGYPRSFSIPSLNILGSFTVPTIIVKIALIDPGTLTFQLKTISL